MKIGLISDTHGFMDESVFKYFSDCDQVWHLGDIGSIEILERLEHSFDVRAVYGNIDGQDIRIRTSKVILLDIEQKRFLLTHIAGRPGKYNSNAKELIRQHRPDVLICGHSHILQVEQDQTNKLLFINPGAAGRHGFHKKKTLIRFDIEQGRMYNLEVIDMGNRSNLN
jgi:putative phosphoesterase